MRSGTISGPCCGVSSCQNINAQCRRTARIIFRLIDLSVAGKLSRRFHSRGSDRWALVNSDRFCVTTLLNAGTNISAVSLWVVEAVVESSPVKKPGIHSQRWIVESLAPVQNVVAQDALAGFQAAAEYQIRALIKNLPEGGDGLPG